MQGRSFGTVCLAAAWSMVVFTGLTLGWIHLGAAFIGILGTIGLEPPRLRPAPAARPSLI
jgi:hypothetical protein